MVANLTTDRHIPGPWSVEDPIDGDLSIVETNKPTHEWKFIAVVYLREGSDPDEFPHHVSEANARLIAAAPTMHSKLERIATWVRKANEGDASLNGALQEIEEICNE